MISRTSTLLFLAAWVVALPRASSAGMAADDARYLLMRTGFAASVAQVQAFSRVDREAAVERILRETRNSAFTTPPACTHARLLQGATVWARYAAGSAASGIVH
jgi:hypothetical protein